MFEINVIGGTLTQEEIDAYLQRAEKKFGAVPHCLDIHVDGDFVDLKYQFEDIPFERIRRVTGYLTGTLDRWNDAKRAEEKDRVKHGICS